KDLLAAVVRQRVRPAPEVGQREIGRLQRPHGARAVGCALAEGPDAVGIVVDDRLAEQTCQFGNIESRRAVAQEFPFPAARYRHAHVAAARAFGPELPAGRGMELADGHPQVVVLRFGSRGVWRPLIVEDGRAHWFLRTWLTWRVAAMPGIPDPM